MTRPLQTVGEKNLHYTEALISKLDSLKSPCIVKYVKASAIFEPFKVSKTMKILYLL